MKHLRFFICFLLCQFTLAISPLTLIADEPVSLLAETENQDKSGKIEYIIKQAKAYREAEKFAEAEKLLKEALAKYTHKEDQKKLKVELADVHLQWADILIKENSLVQAVEHTEAAYAIDKSCRAQIAAVDLFGLGMLYWATNDRYKALECYEKLLPFTQSLGDKKAEIMTRSQIGEILIYNGQTRQALDHYKKIVSISKFLGDQAREALALLYIGQIHDTLGEMSTALECLGKALIIFKNLADEGGEAETLNSIGHVYSLNNRKKALEYFHKALKLYEEIGNKPGKGIVLNNIGFIHQASGRLNDAIIYYRRALPLMRSLNHSEGEAEILNNLAYLYYSLGQTQQALEYLKQAFTNTEKIGFKTALGLKINNIGFMLNTLGQPHKALEFYNRALRIFKTADDKKMLAITMSNIGHIYHNLGQTNKALKYYQKALPLARSSGHKSGEANALINIGKIYAYLGKVDEAHEHFSRAQDIAMKVGDQKARAMAISYMAALLVNIDKKKGKNEKKASIGFLNVALRMTQDIGDRTGEAATLNQIGEVYFTLGQQKEAWQYFTQALLIWHETGSRSGKAQTLGNLMECWSRLPHPYLSIYYGKQAVNEYQNLRSSISNLNRESQRSFFKTKIDTYRQLADLLIREARLAEAQQVMDMLKEEEIFDFLLRDSSISGHLSTRMDFTPFESQWLRKHNPLIAKLADAFGRHHFLKFTDQPGDKKSDCEKLHPQMTLVKKEYQSFLDRLHKAFFDQQWKIKKKEGVPEIARKAGKLKTTLAFLDESEGGKHVALHYLVYEGRISVILTTPSSQSVKQTEIDEKELNVMILNYRNLTLNLGKVRRKIREMVKRGQKLLETPDYTLEKKLTKEKQAIEKKLYEAIFKPVEKELKTHGATNLVVSLDGVLRYIPLPALWDGESYLVQNYRISLITPSSLKNIMDIPVKEKKILGLGASRGGQGFAPLPYVGREIRSIVRDEERGYYGLIKGKAFIDKDFTKDTMVSQLKKNEFPLVHISSHFKFSPGDETKNHLLLGDGTSMKLSEIRQMGKLFDNVQLLVLSACQTGVGGNGEEIDGFGELAQQSGAKSVVASLWPVADESTKELMVAFYRKLKEGKVTGKIEALRQAQLELAGLEDLLGKEKGKIQGATRSKTKYSSSYFWGPFIMIGNWR